MRPQVEVIDNIDIVAWFLVHIFSKRNQMQPGSSTATAENICLVLTITGSGVVSLQYYRQTGHADI